MAVKTQRQESVPVSVEIRMYNVGLGDSFLLTFNSRAGRKLQKYRILIDCGSTGRNSSDGPSLAEVAHEIVKDCGGKDSILDAIVVTHRHQDHMSGFGGAAGEILTKNLRPRMIVQPWTEEPNAQNPKAGANSSQKAAAEYAVSLHDAQTVTDSILSEILVRHENGMERTTDEAALFYCQKNLPFGEGLTFRKAANSKNEDLLAGLNVEALKNVDAIANLQNWSWKSGRKKARPSRKYVQKGESVRFGIPGLSVEVLGPVGPKQWEELDTKGRNLNEELWQKLRALRGVDQPGADGTDSDYVSFEERRGVYGVPSIFPMAERVDDTEFEKDSVRWLREKLDQLRGDQLLQFVTVLDKHINNTSVVLLLEFGGFRMLFPGDAEVAAWQAITTDSNVNSSLKALDLYKVGHHCSNNATPIRSLWEKMTADRDADSPLHCLVSTQTTKFRGSIPNRSLLDTMLDADHFHVVSTAYLDGQVSAHADDWTITAGGTGSERLVMSYARVFELKT